MSIPPPVPPGPPDHPEIPPVPGAAVGPPPVPPAYPSGPPPVPDAPVGPPPSSGGSGTRGLVYGCLGLLAIAGIVAVIGGLWVFNKAKAIAANPEQFIAEMAVKANPDLELIRLDNVTKEVVIKDKKSGETVTMTIDEIKNGKLTLKKSDGSSAEVGADGIRVKDKDGSETVVGGAAPVPLPEWVPAFPGGHQVVMSSHKIKGANQSGQYVFTTGGSVEEAAAAYLKVLEENEFQVTREEASVQGSGVINLEAQAVLESGGRQRIGVRLLATDAKTTTVHLDYSQEEPAAP